MAVLVSHLFNHSFFKRPKPHFTPSIFLLAEPHFTDGENEAPGKEGLLKHLFQTSYGAVASSFLFCLGTVL